jgi:hypothetical protein
MALLACAVAVDARQGERYRRKQPEVATAHNTSSSCQQEKVQTKQEQQCFGQPWQLLHCLGC